METEKGRKKKEVNDISTNKSRTDASKMQVKETDDDKKRECVGRAGEYVSRISKGITIVIHGIF